MNTYRVLHPIGGHVNEAEDTTVEYETVALVKASSLEEVFSKAQNHNKNYSKFNVRSTSIGDVIYCNHVFHMITGVGFVQISYIKHRLNTN